MDKKKENTAGNAVQKANKGFAMTIMDQVNKVASNAGNELSREDREYAMDIILTTYKKLDEEGIDPNSVNFIGCSFPNQIKRFARLGLSLGDYDMYLDIRNNTKAGKKDINLKMQYQGEEKLLIRFNKKSDGIVNIIKDVIMEGEELETSRDFKTGDYVITDHKIHDILHRNVTHDNKDKLIGAYAIAYHKNGSQTAIIIDKVRIDRAYNACPQPSKTIWKSDYKAMVLKTAVHDLFKVLRPYNEIPVTLQSDLNAVELGKEEVDEEIREKANSEVFDADFTTVDDSDHQIESIKEPANHVHKEEPSESEPF